MAQRHDRLFAAAAEAPGETIPLESRRAQSDHNELAVQDSDTDLDPESDAVLLRRHRSLESDAGSNKHDALEVTTLPSVFHRIAVFMSKARLLLRSSPALGTSSYGSVPVRQSDTESDQSGEDDVRRRTKRKQSHNSLASVGRYDGRAGSSRIRHSTSRSSKGLQRTSSNTSDIGMGPESKASFATGSGFGATGPSSPSDSGEEGFDVDEDTVTDDDADPPDNSPYPEVRASVPATDNTSLSINTPRMWTLSLFFALAGSATNLFFSLRYPSVAITPVIALVIVHPLGKLWDLLLKHDDDPKETYINGEFEGRDSQEENVGHKSGFRLWLAQGRWNEKEHACVYISSNVAFGFAFATDVGIHQSRFKYFTDDRR